MYIYVDDIFFFTIFVVQQPVGQIIYKSTHKKSCISKHLNTASRQYLLDRTMPPDKSV